MVYSAKFIYPSIVRMMSANGPGSEPWLEMILCVRLCAGLLILSRWLGERWRERSRETEVN